MIPPDKIILRRRNGDVCGFALVDHEHFAALSRFQWRLLPGKTVAYAARYTRDGGKFRAILMHREILGEVVNGLFADHINGDGLDNRRCNLRTATRSQNVRNRRTGHKPSGRLKGTAQAISKNVRRWKAQIGYDGKNYNLGHFDTEQQAHEAYCVEARRVFGAFANDGSSAIGIAQ